jgi:hypothetical protein
MKRSLILTTMVSLLFATPTYAADLKLVVKQRFGRPAQERPFPDLIGFSLRSSPFGGTAHPAASCPNATNGKGEATCTIECKSASIVTMRLYVHGPAPETSPSLKGYVDPGPQVVEFDRCVQKPSKAIIVLYRTPENYYAEVAQMYPAVFGAVGLLDQTWAEPLKVSVLPFGATAKTLEGLTIQDAGNLEGVDHLSKLASVYQRLPPDQKNPETAKRLKDYEFGAASIVLRGIVGRAQLSSSSVVRVSPSPEEYYRSVSELEGQLKNRNVLTASQAHLYEGIKTFRQSSTGGGVITVEMLRDR